MIQMDGSEMQGSFNHPTPGDTKLEPPPGQV